MLKIRQVLLCLLLAVVSLANAQSRKITGQVTSESDGEPIPGVTIQVQGQEGGEISDMDGKYSITVSSDEDVLVFSFIGMEQTMIAVGNKTVINPKMTSSVKDIDEVMVVAYGTANKATITGASEIVKSDEITKVSVSNVTQAIQGKAAGVQVTASSGRPGADGNIKIRGVGSISAGSTPLYVIDGIPQGSSGFSALNPSDIESMTILKDASATSIYGSRGSNGVVLITTRQGKTGETTVDATAEFGLSYKTQDKFNMMNTQQKLEYERQLGVGLGMGMTDAQINAYADSIDTDWSKEIYRTGKKQAYNVSISSGTEKSKTYASINYSDEEAIVYGSDLKKGGARINSTFEVNSKIEVGISSFISASKENLVRDDRNALNPNNYVYSANPYDLPRNSDGSYSTLITPSLYGINVFENIDKNPTYISYIKGVGSAYFSYNILKDLNFKTTIGIDYRQSDYYQYNQPDSKLSIILGSPYGYRNDTFSRRATSLWNNVLTYKKTLAGAHNLKLQIGSEAQESNYRTYTAKGKGYSTSAIDALDNAAQADGIGGKETGWSLVSFFGIATYDFNEKYFVDASIRRDGCSRFGEDFKYGNFWAVGAGWNIHDEAFFNVNWIDRLKVRGSTGISGNNNIGDYAAQGVYGAGSYNGSSTQYPRRLANDELTWEKSLSSSFGFDFSGFSNRLDLTVDYFYRNTTDMLLDVQLTRTSGFSSRTDNIGEMTNKGIEITAGSEIYKTDNLSIKLHANFTAIKNEVTKLYNGDDITIGWNNIVSEGLPLYNYKMVRWAGVNPINGDALYYTADGEITNVYNGDDAVVLDDKTPLPKFYGGFGGAIEFHNVEFSFDFNYNYGNYIYNHVSFFTLSDGAQATSNQDARLLTDQWLKPGDITDIPKQSTANSQNMSDRFLEDGSYLRLRNVTLAYSFPKDMTKKIGIRNLRVYAQGYNILTFTNYSGLDPEIGDTPADDTGSFGSVSDYNYPCARTYVFGLQVGF